MQKTRSYQNPERQSEIASSRSYAESCAAQPHLGPFFCVFSREKVCSLELWGDICHKSRGIRNKTCVDARIPSQHQFPLPSLRGLVVSFASWKRKLQRIGWAGHEPLLKASLLFSVCPRHICRRALDWTMQEGGGSENITTKIKTRSGLTP